MAYDLEDRGSRCVYWDTGKLQWEPGTLVRVTEWRGQRLAQVAIVEDGQHVTFLEVDARRVRRVGQEEGPL